MNLSEDSILSYEDSMEKNSTVTLKKKNRNDEFLAKQKEKVSLTQDDKTIESEIENEIVNELNKRHAVVHTNQFYILTEKSHPLFDGIDFTLESRQSFINTYENQMILCSDGKTKSKAKIWLAHQERRHFDGIIFDPSTTEHKNGKYNIWKEFAIVPKNGSCKLLKKHIKEVICGGSDEYFEYVWRWMAHLIQHPQELSPGLVLMGEQGVGKNTIVDALGAIFGQHYMPLDNIDQFLGHFNFHLKMPCSFMAMRPSGVEINVSWVS